MFTYEIEIDFSEQGYNEDIEQDTYGFLSSFYDSRQIISNSYQFIRSGNKLKIPVACPEVDSLDRKNCSEYAIRYIDRLKDRLKREIAFIRTGTEARYEEYAVPAKSSYYILYHGKFSPLLCGDTFQPIPLYKIPYTYHDHKCYNDIRTWDWNYESLYGLWISGTVGEKFALHQLQQVHSSLSIEGRTICERIEKLTGVPTYYFLFNYRAWGRRRDAERKCPVTGKSWLIAGTTFNHFIAFKSDEARLVSELSSNR